MEHTVLFWTAVTAVVAALVSLGSLFVTLFKMGRWTSRIEVLLEWIRDQHGDVMSKGACSDMRARCPTSLRSVTNQQNLAVAEGKTDGLLEWNRSLSKKLERLLEVDLPAIKMELAAINTKLGEQVNGKNHRPARGSKKT